MRTLRWEDVSPAPIVTAAPSVSVIITSMHGVERSVTFILVVNKSIDADYAKVLNKTADSSSSVLNTRLFCFFSSHCNNIKHLIICVKYSMLLMGSDGTF